MNWYIEVLKKYAVFEGRARRQEYWMFSLFHFLVMFALLLLEGIAPGVGVALTMLYLLATFVPSIAVGVRRMHDTGHSGWWLLAPIVPFVFSLQDSQAGSNSFGANPKELAPPAHVQARGRVTQEYAPPVQYAPVAPTQAYQQQAYYQLIPQRNNLGLPVISLPTPGNYRLGRTPSANVQLVVPSPHVSSEHLWITINPDYSVVVEDVGSTNGTRINGIGLPPRQLQALHVGQTLQLGHDEVAYTLQRG
jgi:uncharacterized membrane protein YhaH (DUF805 family)